MLQANQMIEWVCVCVTTMMMVIITVTIGTGEMCEQHLQQEKINT
jgi:hypothetical protein